MLSNVTTTSPADAVSRSEEPVLKLRSPSDICEAVPFLVGFDPTCSLVVVSLRGDRQRVGVVARVDLLDDPSLADVLARHLTDQLDRDRASAAILVAYAEAGDPSPDPFVEAMLVACERRCIDVPEALRVTNGSWTSYTCAMACCPPTGTRMPDRVREPGLPTTTLVAEGRQVMASRAALVKSVAPVTGLLAASMSERITYELDHFVDVMNASAGGRAAGVLDRYADETVALIRSWVERLADHHRLPVDQAARMIAGLIDRGARDRCLSSCLGRLPGDPEPPVGPQAITLWRELVRRAVEPGTAAPVATLLAACAYLEHGNGALTNVALDRALADDPEYVLALYLRSFVDSGTPPSTLREWITGSAVDGGGADQPKRRQQRPRRRSPGQASAGMTSRSKSS